MIRQYIGLLGQGKTLSMVNDSIPYITKRLKVFSNFEIILNNEGEERDHLKSIYLPGESFIEAFMTEYNALFLIDEAQILFPSYNPRNLTIDLQIRMSQSRKYGLHIFYSSQGYNHVHMRLRSLTNEVVKCQKLRAPFFQFRNIYYDPDYFHDQIKSFTLEQEKEYILGRSMITKKQAKKLYKFYNTYQVVDTSALETVTRKHEQPKRTLYKLFDPL